MYFIPEHEKKLLIQFEIDKFRDYIKNKKEKIRTQKNLLEKMMQEEEQLEKMFMNEIADELDKKEKQEEELTKKKYEEQRSNHFNIEKSSEIDENSESKQSNLDPNRKI